MANSYPFTSGAVLTAAELNSLGEWEAFDPAFFFFTAGNATTYGRYSRVGNVVHYYAEMIVGSTTSVNNGFSWTPTGSLGFGLDPAFASSGRITVIDVSASQDYDGFFSTTDATRWRPTMYTSATSAVTASASSPMSWSTGDILRFWGSALVD